MIKLSHPNVIKTERKRRFAGDRRRRYTWTVVEYQGSDGAPYRKSFWFEDGMSIKDMSDKIPKSGENEKIKKLCSNPFIIKGAVMKRSKIHQIIGCLVEAGRSDLAETVVSATPNKGIKRFMKMPLEIRLMHIKNAYDIAIKQKGCPTPVKNALKRGLKTKKPFDVNRGYSLYREWRQAFPRPEGQEQHMSPMYH